MKKMTSEKCKKYKANRFKNLILSEVGMTKNINYLPEI